MGLEQVEIVGGWCLGDVDIGSGLFQPERKTSQSCGEFLGHSLFHIGIDRWPRPEKWCCRVINRQDGGSTPYSQTVDHTGKIRRYTAD